MASKIVYLAHSAVSWQTLACDSPLESWSEHNVHLALLPLPELDDLLLQEQVLAAIIGEHYDQGSGGGDLDTNLNQMNLLYPATLPLEPP